MMKIELNDSCFICIHCIHITYIILEYMYIGIPAAHLDRIENDLLMVGRMHSQTVFISLKWFNVVSREKNTHHV